MPSRLQAPTTFDVPTSTSYLGDGSEIFIEGARSIQIGFSDGAGFVAGVLKILIGSSGHSIEIPVPASNLWSMEAGCGCVLPTVRVDAKSAADTPRLVVVVV